MKRLIRDKGETKGDSQKETNNRQRRDEKETKQRQSRDKAEIKQRQIRDKQIKRRDK